ncbi:MAG TPA: hypothetical protein G4N97_00805 [Thermoflexia bacterium]|nr:hypothetical protein [Thermoflexia bacterium]
MPIVVIADTTQGLKPALEAIFAPHGGVGCDGILRKASSGGKLLLMLTALRAYCPAHG